MNRVHTAGFTIIEVMLFLAVTGALTVGILASSQVAINEQRYRDTLTGVQSKLQQQYNQTAHVINTRGDASLDECDDSGADVSRGTSNCVMIGRLVRVGQVDVTMTPLVAKPSNDISPGNGVPDELEDSTPDSYDTEEIFGLYELHNDEDLAEVYEVPWSTKTGLAVDEELRILILRSPQTGLIHTYSAVVASTTSTSAAALGSIVTVANSGERKVCIPRGGFGNSRDLGIILRANAASAAAVELMTDSDACSS